MATSRKTAAIKRAKVVEAVADGATYQEAAEQAGYATRSGAYKAYWAAVDSRVAEAVDDHRMLEVSRLDALQVPLWEKAMSGDVKAIVAVLRIIEQRSRLLGLDRPGSWKTEPETVVLSPDQLARWKETQEPDA